MSTCYVDPSNLSAGITILFSGGDLISETIDDGTNTWSPVPAATRAANPTATFSFALNLVCDKDLTGTPTITGPTFNSTTFTYTVEVQSADGEFISDYKRCLILKIACPILTLDEVSQFISDNDIVFCIVGIIIGLLIAFLGLKLFLPTLFLVGFISGFFICLVRIN